LDDFFRKTVEEFLEPDLSALGRWIIECCLDGGSIEEYEDLIPSQKVLTSETEKQLNPQVKQV
jgi:hypothetical protein